MTTNQDLRCSSQTKELNEPPGGTAGHINRLVLIELPAPWPSKIDDHPEISGLVASRFAKKAKVLAIAAAEPGALPSAEPSAGGINTTAPDHGDRRLICYSVNPDSPFTKFDRFELFVPQVDLVSVAQGFLDAEHEDLPGLLPTSPSQQTQMGQSQPDSTQVVDLLVCTHGTRDRCCGRFGTLLALEIQTALDTTSGLTAGAQTPSHTGGAARVWRASHIGGHRFAPTTMTLPDGMMWANADCDTMLGIIDRSADALFAASRLRGSIAIDSAGAQIADGFALSQLGWSWIGEPRSWHMEPIINPANSSSTCTISSPTTDVVVVLELGDLIPVPSCGEPIEQSEKSVKQLKVTASRLNKIDSDEVDNNLTED